MVVIDFGVVSDGSVVAVSACVGGGKVFVVVCVCVVVVDDVVVSVLFLMVLVLVLCVLCVGDC